MGLIPKPEREGNGYRVFTDYHVDVFKLARTAFQIEVLQNGLRKKIVQMVKAAAAHDFDLALTLTDEYLQQVQREIENAQEAIDIVKQILTGYSKDNTIMLKRNEAAKLLQISMDSLRNWELNGLLDVKRRENGYRVYAGEDIDRLKVIRSLRCANYSLEAILRMLLELTVNPDTDIGKALDTPRPDDDIVSVYDKLLTSLNSAEQNAKLIQDMLQDISKNTDPPLCHQCLCWWYSFCSEEDCVMENVIKVEQLTKSYQGCTAVDRVSLTVKQGTVFGLLGANGAGKSTTIECILGTKTPDGGTVSVLGMNPRIQRKALFERVGVQFQSASYHEKITVKELCEETAALYRQAADYPSLLKQFGIADKAKSPVEQLSGGERQRLFIVLALIPNPKVVFLDELTTGLDTKARREVWRKLSEMKANGMTILLTSHLMDEVEALCDLICILKRGKTVFYGTVDQAIKESPYDKFEDAYLWFTDGEEMQYESV